MRASILVVAAVLAAASVGCGRGESSSRGESGAGTAASSGTGDTTASSGAWHPPAPGVPCPSTGSWGPCTLLERLERAGLAPRVSQSMVGEPPLRQSGHLVRLGSAELKVFLYPDSTARLEDEARLDPRRYIEATQNPTLRNEATIIRSANLLAILHSKSGTQRERVSLAITAGPPQPKP